MPRGGKREKAGRPNKLGVGAQGCLLKGQKKKDYNNAKSSKSRKAKKPPPPKKTKQEEVEKRNKRYTDWTMREQPTLEGPDGREEALNEDEGQDIDPQDHWANNDENGSEDDGEMEDSDEDGEDSGEDHSEDDISEDEVPDEADPEFGEETNRDNLVTLEEATIEEAADQDLGAPSFEERLWDQYCELPSPEWPEKMAALIQEQAARADSIPPTSLAVAYNAEMEKHADDTIAESTNRGKDIWKYLGAKGILDVATKLEEPRMAAKEDILNAHTERLYNQVEKWTEEAERVENDETQKAKFEEKTFKKSLLINKHTLEVAQLASGTVISCVEHVMEKGGAALALERPPGRSLNLSVIDKLF